MKAFVRRNVPLGLSLIALAAYYFRFSVNPEGMTLYPQAAECMLKGLPMNACSPSFTYPPLFAFIMIPFTFLPMWARNIVWYLVSVGLTFGSFRLAEILVLEALEKPLRENQLVLFRVVSVALVLNFMLAVLENQAYDVLVLFFVLIGLTGLAREKESWLAVGFGLACALKATPLLFLPYLFIKKGWKLFSLCLVSYLALSLLPDVFFSVDGGQATYYGNWIRQVALPPFVDGIPGGMTRFWEGVGTLNQSLRPSVLRLTLKVGIPEYFPWILYGVYGLCVLYGLMVFAWSSKSKSVHVLDGSIIIIGMLLLSPMSSKSHFVALMLPFMVITAYMLTEPPLRQQLMLASGLSCLLDNFSSTDLVGHKFAAMTGDRGSVTIGTIILAVAIGYLASAEAKRRRKGHSNHRETV